MSLKRYLLITYALTLGGLFVVCGLMADHPEFPLIPMLVMSPLIALVKTFVNVWPWALRVPVERRTGFRGYRVSNIFMALLGALLILGIASMLAGI